MALVSDAVLADLRTRAATVRTDTATISRPTRAADGQGGTTTTWTSAGTATCYLTPMRQQPTEGPVAERLQDRVGYYLYLDHDADVRAADRLVVGAATYEVLGVQAPATLLVHLRADCALEA